MDRGLDHRALLYAGTEQFVRAGARFVREGLDRDEPVWLVTDTPRTRDLLDALGDDAARVDTSAFGDRAVTPARMLTRITHRLSGTRSEPHILGEVAVAGADSGTTRDWIRYEALVNHAFGRSRAHLLCLYDAERVEERVLEDARRTHPVLETGSGLVPSPAYTAPEAMLRELHAAELGPVPAGAATLRFDDRPAPARDFVAEEAKRAGLRAPAAEDLRVAVAEIVTNAILHGRRPHWISLWTTDTSVVCEVADGGPGIASPLCGHLVPDLEAPGGRGVWIARQLCDRVEIAGARVRLHMARPAASG